MTQQISKVNFTYAIPGGMWVEYSDGARTWKSFTEIHAEVGCDESDRLYKIAYANGMTGMWYEV